MSNQGSITLTSGTSPFRPGPGWSIVGAFCGAINSAVKALAVELAMEQEYATGSVLLIDGGTLVM
jgi:hypothetical protein